MARKFREAEIIVAEDTRTLKEIQESNRKMELENEYLRGWIEGHKVGFNLAFQELCSHPAEKVEAQFNEDELFAYCTVCEKDLAKDYLDKMPDYIDDPTRDELPVEYQDKAK